MGPQEGKTPLTRLVLFMVCLSFAGAFVAGLQYYAVDLPQQNAVKVPENTSPSAMQQKCIDKLISIMERCQGVALTSELYRACDRAISCVSPACYAPTDDEIQTQMMSCGGDLWTLKELLERYP